MAGEAAARLPTFVELYEQIERLAPGLTGPDWVCEILSPSTGRDDGRSKLPLYASEDVRHVWLIEPEARLVEVFETRDGRAVQRTSGVDDDVLELPPFVDAALDLAPLWAPRKS